MKKIRITFLLFFILGSTIAQVRDDFSDGELDAPPWTGNTSSFIINANQQLQLSAVGAGTAYLSTPWQATLGETEWDFLIRQNFSPSSSNYGRLYLASSAADLTSSLSGYFIQFGEAGANDAIQLFRQEGAKITSVCRAKNGAIASAFQVRIKVLRDALGVWELWVDYSGGTQFTLEAIGQDAFISSSIAFGWVCVYTSSNATKFYLDDIYAGPQIRDITPPVCQSVQALTSRSVELVFSESLDSMAAINLNHFTVIPDVGQPNLVEYRPDSNMLIVHFALPFPNGIPVQILLTGITDRSGNVMANTVLDFLYFEPFPVNSKDIMITELMADPTPAIGLPEEEFVELYNRSEHPVQLEGFTLSDGTSRGMLSKQILLPYHYVIICSTQNSSLFTPFGKVCASTLLPSMNNSTDTLVLKNSKGITIDSVHYGMSWYHDHDKQDGGWSLELIDAQNPCGEENNWLASEDPSGGTPGKVNSVAAEKPDLIGPALVGVVASAHDLTLIFDEKLETSAVTDGIFTLIPAVQIVSRRFADKALRSITLSIDSLHQRQLYQVEALDVRDCNENQIQAEHHSLTFALPEKADSLDVILNEVLFNPRPAGTDFVELMNISDKFINLRQWKLANFENGVAKNLFVFFSEDLMMAPHQILALTSDRSALISNYPATQEKKILTCALPSLPDDEGSIAVVDEKGRVMDALLYNRKFHSPMLQNPEGVSLERIDGHAPTQIAQNWKSATSASGYATPGEINSNARPVHPLDRGKVIVDPEVLQPSAGTPDFTQISYSFDQAGLTASVRVLDHEGHLVRTIGNNELLGYEGFFRWEGDRDDGSLARSGYYIIWMEVFDTKGYVAQFRKRAIVMNR